MRRSIPILLLAAVAISSCSKSGDSTLADSCAGVTTSYNADIRPIFITTCSIDNTCHGAGSTNVGGEFTDYNKIYAKRTTIKAQVAAGIMPQSGSLSASQKTKLICWIDSGAPNN